MLYMIIERFKDRNAVPVIGAFAIRAGWPPTGSVHLELGHHGPHDVLSAHGMRGSKAAGTVDRALARPGGLEVLPVITSAEAVKQIRRGCSRPPASPAPRGQAASTAGRTFVSATGSRSGLVRQPMSIGSYLSAMRTAAEPPLSLMLLPGVLQHAAIPVEDLEVLLHRVPTRMDLAVGREGHPLGPVTDGSFGHLHQSPAVRAEQDQLARRPRRTGSSSPCCCRS